MNDYGLEQTFKCKAVVTSAVADPVIFTTDTDTGSNTTIITNTTRDEVMIS